MHKFVINLKTNGFCEKTELTKIGSKTNKPDHESKLKICSIIHSLPKKIQKSYQVHILLETLRNKPV